MGRREVERNVRVCSVRQCHEWQKRPVIINRRIRSFFSETELDLRAPKLTKKNRELIIMPRSRQEQVARRRKPQQRNNKDSKDN